MSLPRAIASGLHLLAIFAMSGSAAYLFPSSFVFGRWLEEPSREALGWNSTSLAWALFGVFVSEGLLLSFLGRRPGLFTFLLALFLLPSLYAHSSLQWLEFAGIDVEPAHSEALVSTLGTVLVAGYLLCRTGLRISDMEQDLKRRNALATDIHPAVYFSLALLLGSLATGVAVGMGLAYTVEPVEGFLEDLMERAPLEVLTIGISTVALMAWIVGRLVSGREMLPRDLLRWRR
ncbi:MAG: hypothetical protein HYX93_01345 [Chloroflexi bacterium]|nr:hypothetical protein [Chloroflexota bacterium]